MRLLSVARDVADRRKQGTDARRATVAQRRSRSRIPFTTLEICRVTKGRRQCNANSSLSIQRSF